MISTRVPGCHLSTRVRPASLPCLSPVLQLHAWEIRVPRVAVAELPGPQCHNLAHVLQAGQTLKSQLPARQRSPWTEL